MRTIPCCYTAQRGGRGEVPNNCMARGRVTNSYNISPHKRVLLGFFPARGTGTDPSLSKSFIYFRWSFSGFVAVSKGMSSAPDGVQMTSHADG